MSSECIDDCSWSEAFAKAKTAGGYLAHIDDPQEYAKILSDIRTEEMTDVEFRIGARRAPDGTDYYWVDEANKTYGEKINSESYWAYPEWLAGEPSYRWDENSKEFISIYFSDEENKRVWNDVADQVYRPGNGECGYIVEFDQ